MSSGRCPRVARDGGCRSRPKATWRWVGTNGTCCGDVPRRRTCSGRHPAGRRAFTSGSPGGGRLVRSGPRPRPEASPHGPGSTSGSTPPPGADVTGMHARHVDEALLRRHGTGARATIADPVFQLEDVSVHYGDFAAVAEVTFDIPKGEITAMIGPSGCGKSTLLRAMNRMNDLIDTARVGGRHHLPRRGPLRPRGRPRRGQPPHRDGVPEAEPVPEVDLRQRGLRAAAVRAHRRARRDGGALAAGGRAVGRGQGLAHPARGSRSPAGSSSACASRARSRPNPT
jgi:hypothetical protein